MSLRQPLTLTRRCDLCDQRPRDGTLAVWEPEILETDEATPARLLLCSPDWRGITRLGEPARREAIELRRSRLKWSSIKVHVRGWMRGGDMATEVKLGYVRSSLSVPDLFVKVRQKMGSSPEGAVFSLAYDRKTQRWLLRAYCTTAEARKWALELREKKFRRKEGR
jgi:hypothetical protein